MNSPNPDPFDPPAVVPVNPYAATSETLYQAPEVEDAEACRRKYLSHGSSVKLRTSDTRRRKS